MNRVFYAILLIVGLSLMVMPLSVPVFKSSADYSVINTNSTGTSSFGKLLYSKGGVSPILGPLDSTGISDEKGTLVIIGPNIDFAPGEISSVRAFLENGNTLLLADDFGTGNELLEGLGLKERLSKEPIVSPAYLKNGNFTITTDIRDESLARNVEFLLTYRPSAILHAGSALVYSPNASRVGKEYGPFPLLEVIPYGKGRIILVSDPDVFTNSLFAENRAFIENLLNYMPGPYYIDEAHHRDFNPYSSGTITIRRVVKKELVFYYVLGVALLAFLVETGLWVKPFEWIFSLLFRLFGGEEENLEETIKSLEEEGLDGELLRKIIWEIRTGSKLGGGDGR